MESVITDEIALANIAANVTRLIDSRTYAEIARACCTGSWTCYPGTVEKVAKGQHMPGAGLLARLAEALGVTANDLLDKPAPPRSARGRTPNGSRLSRAS